MRILLLILRGGWAFFREGAGRACRTVARVEKEYVSRLAAFPASLIEGGALFSRALLKGSGEGLFAALSVLLLLLLFVLLR